ncbi:TIM-barrel domain-containing protein [Actomonas aquatica]|uniref:Glycoside hydrolase family 31 protein n=1 Tax=Actomonas aquatica TaxID=2866162 RepID=A0ABZ1C3W7_9BACT|nr:TIM-barrel domain-containing protein [Opitutus sp. WL0086]WRQ86396.1 glycoside hydrolase family 31 protein [Opitutus sp. WL0086]
MLISRVPFRSGRLRSVLALGLLLQLATVVAAVETPRDLLDWLRVETQWRETVDHTDRETWLTEARRAHAASAESAAGDDDVIAVTRRQVQARLLAEWSRDAAERAQWLATAQRERARVDALLWDSEHDELRATTAASPLEAVYWPLVAGAVRRELAIEVGDAWLAQPELPARVAGVDDALWLARGFERYGRRDVAAVVLDLARAQPWGDAAQLDEAWARLTGGEAGRVLPPPTPFPGNPPPVPYWAFRPWVWEDNGNTAETTLSLVDGYKARDIPVGAVIIDSPWSTAYNDFNWDPARYPDPRGLVDALHDRGIKVVMWLTGTVNETSKDTLLQADPMGDEVVARGYAVDGGRVFDWWKGRGRLIDFSHPEAVAWWARRFDQVAALGIDGWKVDVSDDYTDEYVDTFLGRLPRATWRQYYYATLHDVSRQRNPDSVVVARPFSHQGGFAAPVSKSTIGWAGDFTGTWEGMRKQVRDLYVSARAGYGTLYYEVGGYQRIAPTKEQLIRHAQLGAFFPVMSNGGANGGLTAHLPWWHDEETVGVYRRFAQWHAALAPYYFGLARESHVTGEPVLRDVDAETWQHRLGRDILVAPVFAADTTREVALPAEGRWRDWWTGAPVESGEWTVPLSHYAVAVREGAVIAVDLREGLADWGLARDAHGLGLWIVPGEARETVVLLPAGEGLETRSVAVSVSADGHHVQVRGETHALLTLLIDLPEAPVAVEGALSWHHDAEHGRLLATIGTGDADVRLRVAP